MPSNIMQIPQRGWTPPAQDPCDCQPDYGCGPGWPPPPFPAFMECWREVAQFKAMVQQIVLEMPIDSLSQSAQFKAAVQAVLDDLGIVPGPGGGGTIVSITPPVNPSAGQTWWDGTTLRVWDGVAWVPESQTRNYVQVAPPANPNPGDQWWNGTQQRIWDGTAWELVGPGLGTGPGGVSATTHAFSLSVGTDSMPVDPGYTMIPFTSAPLVDPQGMWQSTTQKISPKTAGNYLVTVTGWALAGTGQNQLFMLKNDAGVLSADNLNTQMAIAVGGANAAAGAGESIGGTGVTFMNGTTDFMRLWLFHTGANFYPFAPQVPVIDIWLLP